MSINFKFITDKPSYDTAKVFFIKIDPNIKSVQKLLESLFYQLWFPGYFGFNWNALDDFLTDFSWIFEKKIVIAHNDIPKINKKDLQIYLQIINDAVLELKKNNVHELEVLFQEKDKKKIENMLRAKPY